MGNQSLQFEALFDKVILKEVDKEKRRSKEGIILNSDQNTMLIEAEVVSMGNGVIDSQREVDPQFEVGDLVYVPKNTGDRIFDDDNQEFIITNMHQVFSKRKQKEE